MWHQATYAGYQMAKQKYDFKSLKSACQQQNKQWLALDDNPKNKINTHASISKINKSHRYSLPPSLIILPLKWADFQWTEYGKRKVSNFTVETLADYPLTKWSRLASLVTSYVDRTHPIIQCNKEGTFCSLPSKTHNSSLQNFWPNTLWKWPSLQKQVKYAVVCYAVIIYRIAFVLCRLY